MNHAYAISIEQHYELAKLHRRVRMLEQERDTAEADLFALTERIRNERPCTIEICTACDEMIVNKTDERRDSLNCVLHERCFVRAYPECPCCTHQRGVDCKCEFASGTARTELSSDDQGAVYGNDDMAECITHNRRFEPSDVWGG